MNDSAMYSGIDSAPDSGVFGNEVVEPTVVLKLQEQDRQLKELTPKLQDILAMIEAEKSLTLEFIAGYVDTSSELDENYRAELKAAGRYRKYLSDLKTKFALALGEVMGK